jgi:hypothetical protein
MKSVSQLLSHQQSNVLHQLQQHSVLFERFQKELEVSLPTPLNQHCRIANVREKTIVIHADSSLWATRLRFLSPDLIRKWQQDTALTSEFHQIEKIEVRVRPTTQLS